MNIYDFSFKTSDGQSVDLSDHKNKVILIVNTATKCGFASQFADLEYLHQKYKDKGLVVIGFPCDQFLGQEPEKNINMAKVCMENFGVTFILSEKTNMNGKDSNPIFVYLKKSLKSGVFGSKIKWNFTKFLIAKDGTPKKRYSPSINPRNIEKDILELL